MSRTSLGAPASRRRDRIPPPARQLEAGAPSIAHRRFYPGAGRTGNFEAWELKTLDTVRKWAYSASEPKGNE